MANEASKDFNAMLRDGKDMPKIQIITDEKSIEKYGGNRMYFAPPLDYDRVMRQVPEGKLITVGELREYFARQNQADFTDPITAGIFCVHLRLGQLPAVHRRNAVLAHTESKRRAEPQIPRRRGSAESEVGSRGAHHHPKGPNEYPVLCKRL